MVTGNGRFRAELTQVTLHEQHLVAAEEQVSRIAFIAVPVGTVSISFRFDRGGGPICGGMKVRPGEITTLGPGRSLHVRSEGLYRWGAISLPSEVLVRYATALSGAPFLLSEVEPRWRPQPAAGKRLRGLHAAAMRMAQIRPQALVDPEASHGLEQQLIHAVVECLVAGSADAAHPSARRHQDTMVRFEHLLQSQSTGQLRVPQISAALGVSERLLRSLCAEHLGMSPTRYDRLRRMLQVHALLRSGAPEATGVSEVARRHGFRDLGRFAVNYRAAFGELPSITLRRGAGLMTLDRLRESGGYSDTP